MAREHLSQIDNPLVWSITGLLLSLPAMLLPVFIVSAAGIVRTSRADGTVIALYHADYTPLSLVMLFCSIILPVLWLGGLVTYRCCVSKHIAIRPGLVRFSA